MLTRAGALPRRRRATRTFNYHIVTKIAELSDLKLYDWPEPLLSEYVSHRERPSRKGAGRTELNGRPFVEWSELSGCGEGWEDLALTALIN